MADKPTGPGCAVHIRRNADGVVRVHHYNMPWEPHSEYLWLDGGNYSCDCNRHLFFKWSGGADASDEDDEFPCGETAYSVVKIVFPDGSEVPPDDQEALTEWLAGWQAWEDRKPAPEPDDKSDFALGYRCAARENRSDE